MVGVGFPRKRLDKDGKPRYTAYYVDVKGKERSAGTYATKGESNHAWQEAESKLRAGRIGDPARGRMRFQRYVEDTCLPNHEVEAHDPAELHIVDLPAHHAMVRFHADDRYIARACA